MFQEIVNEEEEVVEDDVEETEDDTTEEEDGDEYASLTREEALERLRKADRAIIKNKKAPEPKAEKKVTNEVPSDRIDRIELRQEGYPPEIVDAIMDLGGSQALKNPVIKKTVEDMVVQHKAEQASKVQGGANSSVNTKYSKEDLKNMTVEELEKVLPHAE